MEEFFDKYFLKFLGCILVFVFIGSIVSCTNYMYVTSKSHVKCFDGGQSSKVHNVYQFNDDGKTTAVDQVSGNIIVYPYGACTEVIVK